MPSHNDLVKAGYNQIAGAYARGRHELRSDKYLRSFEELLPKQAEVLDLGCGNGDPIDTYLIKKGHLVTGLDISPQQISLAKVKCPRGHFLVKDMADLEIGEFAVQGVVSFYALFHLPKETHFEILEKINSFLEIDGLLLITMGDQEWEGFHDLYGAKMWSSHYGANKNIELVKKAGFEIILAEIDRSGRESHQIILAKKVKAYVP